MIQLQSGLDAPASGKGTSGRMLIGLSLYFL